MNTLTLVTVLIFGLAIFFVIRVAVIAFRSWWQWQWLKKHGVAAEARILQVEVMDGAGRFLPYARLEVEVSLPDGGSFVTSVASHFQAFELEDVSSDKTISVRYHPAATSYLKIVKKQEQETKIKSLRWQPVSTAAYLSLTQ